MSIACGTCRADPCSCDVQQAPARLISAGDDYAAIAKRETELKAERENLVKMAVLKDQINSELVAEDKVHLGPAPNHPMPSIFDVGTPKLPEGRETQVLGKQSVVVDKATLKGISPNDVYGNLRKRGLLVHMAGGRNSMTLTVGNIRGEKVLVGLFGYGHEADLRLTWDDGLINAFSGVLWDEATTSRSEDYTHLDTLVAATIARCPGTAIVLNDTDELALMLKRNRGKLAAMNDAMNMALDDTLPREMNARLTGGDLAAALDDKDGDEDQTSAKLAEENHRLRMELHEMHMEHLNWMAMMPPNQSDPGDENATGYADDGVSGGQMYPQTSAEELRRHTALSHAMELAKAMQRSDTSRILADAKSFEGFLKGE